MSQERKLTILYASETGTAQELAEQIWRESKRYRFKGKVMAMDDFDPSILSNEEALLFVCSTAGQGDEPSNMLQFWKFLLRRSLPANFLHGVYCAVLSLGDSSFPKFNWVGKRLSKRLSQLGSTEIIPIGLCDDQHDLGHAAVYVPWTRDLFKRLLDLFPLAAGEELQDERQFKWKVNVVQESADTDRLFEQISYITQLPVVENERTTTKDHFQDVRYIKLDATGLEWTPGDVACIRAQNSDEDVKTLFELFNEHQLNLHPDSVIQVKEYDSELPVPTHLQKRLTLWTVSKKYWDLNCVPRPRFFELLALNCQNELEREKLLEFSKPEGQEDLYSYANRPKRTSLEALQDFPHALDRVTIEVLFEMFQPIKPRAFSIASSSRSKTLNLLVAVVEYKTMLKTPRKGFCSNWLKSLAVGDEVAVQLKKGTFKLSQDLAVPLVMCGPGTGLAPFLSIIEDRDLREEKSGPMVLFFGCRAEHKDFHCRKQLKQWEEKGLINVITAFSRDQEDKIYVQHRIKEKADMLKRLLEEQQGHFLISGSMKMMPQQVKEALQEVLGETYVEEMIKTGRYQEETW